MTILIMCVVLFLSQPSQMTEYLKTGHSRFSSHPSLQGYTILKIIQEPAPFSQEPVFFSFLQIRVKKSMNLNLKIQAPGKNFGAPYLSTPASQHIFQ
jgi:hypothetical protein